jgi:xanthine dehydrogenase accessory factor
VIAPASQPRGSNACLRFLQDTLLRGEAAVLVTVTAVIGSASRAVGTHMIVTEQGEVCGSLSGGCIEAAVSAEAHRILKIGQAELIRFGVGSPFIDIRLPCGGGLDLLFSPIRDARMIERLCDLLDQREAASFRLDLRGGVEVERANVARETGWQDETFFVRQDPPLRLFLIGQGEEVEAAAALTLALGAEAVILSPDARIVTRAAESGAQAHLLTTPAGSQHLSADPYCAVLFLFHDHDWEIELMIQALSQPAFFVGAMGSPSTHAKRIAALREQGVSQDQLDRIVGPVGLIPATRDPASLALSALAQIVAANIAKNRRRG